MFILCQTLMIHNINIASKIKNSGSKNSFFKSIRRYSQGDLYTKFIRSEMNLKCKIINLRLNQYFIAYNNHNLKYG